MLERPPCDKCREMHGENELPCETCTPALMTENKDAVSIYLTIRNQVITVGMGDAIDINHHAIKMVMDLYEVENQRDCFEKVTRLFHVILNEQQKKKMKAKDAR